MEITQQSHLIAFDFDGTLFLNDVANWKAYQHALKPHGFDLTLEMYKEHCDGYDYRTFLGLLFDITDEQLLTEIHNTKKAIYPKYYKFITPDTTLLNIAKAKHGKCVTAIVSTASRQSIEEILEIFNCKHLFDFIIAKEDVAHQKPSPECYLHAMIRANACPSTTTIYEDSDTGVTSAILSGATVMRVVRHHHTTSFIPQ